MARLPEEATTRLERSKRKVVAFYDLVLAHDSVPAGRMASVITSLGAKVTGA